MRCKGGNVTSAGWQVTLCDPMWHVSSRSGVATLRTAVHLLLTCSCTADGPRDAMCQSESCQLLHNSVATTCTTSPELIEVMELDGYSRPTCNKLVHSATMHSTVAGVIHQLRLCPPQRSSHNCICKISFKIQPTKTIGIS